MIGLVISVFWQEPSIAVLDKMAQARDVAGLTRLLVGPPRVVSPFQILRTNGAYEVGSKGWHALPLSSIDGKTQYAVFSTPLTNEDSGELLFQRMGKTLRYVPEDDALGVYIRHHQFEISFNIKAKQVDVEDVATFEAVGPATKTFMFRMGPPYRVGAILTADGKPIAFRQAGGIVSVPRPAGNSWKWRIEYSGIVDLPNYAGSISDKEATLTNDYWYPMIARRPTTYEATVHGPRGWVTVGQGEQVDMQETSTERVTKFKMDLPVSFFSLSCGPYKSFFQKIDGRQYGMWSARVPQGQMRPIAPLYASIIQFYERFAPFPFSQYGGLDSETYGGGAMEAYSYATYGGGLPSEDPHEPAHTWWGGLINNTYLHSFWNESFAVYSEGLYAREANLGIPSERRTAFYRVARGEPAYDSYPCARAGAEVGGVASALGYGKGAHVLQMLEQYLGPDRMIHCMREWQRRQPKGVPGEWEDFERVVLDLNPAKDLNGFFDDWLRKPGYARFTASTPAYVGDRLKLNFSWTGAAYRTPVEVMVQFKSGAREFKTFDLRPVGSSAHAEWRLGEKPVLVSIDPYRRMLRDIHDDEAPVQLSTALRGTVVRDAAHPEYANTLKGTATDAGDLGGKVLVGHPDTMPALKPLLDQLGWTVVKNRLTFEDTSIDLNNGAAYAVVDLPDGKRCTVVIGRTQIPANYGEARFGLFDAYGRLLRAKTDPKTSGFMTFKL